MVDSDEEDFVFYGTPIEREEDLTSRKKKAVAEASGQLRTLVAWKQEVRDEEGRRRFHGAFTGGFSAGYYNTVGSKEGWNPQSFTSSRKNRAKVNEQSILNFLDEDEKAELEGSSLATSTQFDTFGFTAAELARKQAEKEQQQRPSAVPGPVPDELVVPATDSIGVKLLLKMGWRQGRSIKNSNSDARRDARKEARKSFLALSVADAGSQVVGSPLDEEDADGTHDLPADVVDQLSKSTPAFVLNPKQDMYGLGYDPFKHAPEFREKKRLRVSGDRGMEFFKSTSGKGKIAPGFGIGALEDLDAEDEDIYTSGYDFEDRYVQEIEESSTPQVEKMLLLDKKKQDLLQGFRAASKSESQFERFAPPQVPRDFIPQHKFPAPIKFGINNVDDPPPEVPPPEDNNLRILIEGVATLVARCGKIFEDLSKEKNRSNPLFAFLNGGEGFKFYARKLWEEQQKRSNHTKILEAKSLQHTQKMTAESRGNILGEKALERSSKELNSFIASDDAVNLQFNLSDTFTKPKSLDEVKEIAKPFSDDPAKQERFEQFLKEKYEGGLRTKDSGGSSKMSEAARARERLEFEAAAEVIQKAKSGKGSETISQMLMDLSASAGLQFTTGRLEEAKTQQNEELIARTMYPKREEFQWRPSPILCKRFDLTDPYMGKPPPAPRVRSKMDSLVFMPDSIKVAKVKEGVATERGSSVPQMHIGEEGRETAEKEVEAVVEVENVERPVDLYKAIFSDDSDDEDENMKVPDQVEDQQKKIEAVNITLNRLIAGDFLESLGKELGLVVPPDQPQSKKVSIEASQKETIKMNKERMEAENMRLADPNAAAGSSTAHETGEGRPNNQELSQEGTFSNHKTSDIDIDRNNGKVTDGGFPGTGGDQVIFKMVAEEMKAKTRTSHRYKRSSSSSEDERRRKPSRKHRDRSRSFDCDTSDISNDYRERHHSSSRRKKRSHREKSGSRKHSRRHKHKRGSSSESGHDTDQEQDKKRKKRRHRD